MAVEQRAALVTAGARRVGRVLALKLAAAGYDIALHYFNSEVDAKNTACEVQELGRRCELIQADLLDKTALSGMIKEALEKLPGLCVLVNNASIWKAGRFMQSSSEELHENLGIHLLAPYILTRDLARYARKGVVVNILDSNISRQHSDKFAYLLSKKSLYDFTLMAAAELAPDVRVNAIAPGLVLSPDGQEQETQPLKNPLHRQGTPEDVAEALLFLVQSKHVTGQCIYLSGGKQLN